MARSGLSATVAGVLLAALTLGCSHSGNKPSTLPSPKPTSATPSPTPSLTVAQQIEAAVRHYVEATNHAISTGETDELKRILVPTCRCYSLIGSIEKLWRQGRFVGEQYRVTHLHAYDLHGTEGAADLRADVSVGRLYDRQSGKLIRTYSGARVHTDLTLVAKEGRWLISQAVGL